MDVTRPDARRPDDDEPLPRRGRRWRWMGLVGLLLVVALSIAYFTWSRKSEARLTELLDELRRAGEPVEPADLVHRPIPTEDDAAPDLRAAVAALDQKSETFDAFNKIDLEQPLGAADREVIVKLVEGERDVLDKLRAARGKRDADWRIPYQSPSIMTLLPHLNDLRSLANLGRAAAIHERLRGNDGAALERLRDVLAVGNAADTQPVMVGHLVALGVRAVAVYELDRAAPSLVIRSEEGNGGTSPGAVTPQQVRDTIRDLLDESRSDAGFAAAFRGERTLQLDTARLIADRKLDIRALSGATPSGGFVPPVPRGLVLTDARLMAEYVTDVLKVAQASSDLPTFRNNQPPLPAPVRGNPKIHFFASMMMPAYDRFITQHFKGKADTRMAATVLALRLYAADHGGRYPDKLDELVPKYLPSVPADPLAAGGAPLKYSAADPSAPVVYSVGEDGVDDGGSTAAIRRSVSSPDRWNMRDAVVPMKPAVLVKSKEEEARQKAGEGE
jgi:hypothetical protein